MRIPSWEGYQYPNSPLDDASPEVGDDVLVGQTKMVIGHILDSATVELEFVDAQYRHLPPQWVDTGCLEYKYEDVWQYHRV